MVSSVVLLTVKRGMINEVAETLAGLHRQHLLGTGA